MERVFPVCLAAEASHGLRDLPVWTVLPFVFLLLSIAILPLAAGHFWHTNRNKALVAGLFALPVVAYLVLAHSAAGAHALHHSVEEYISFIILLGSLYTIAGGIVVRGDIEGKPATNTTVLAIGAVIANLIGTTGASMLLIRPFLRINQQRKHTTHLPIFFIFIVSNVAGLLTPLGDPPLFLGFLNGVDFFWTLQLWRHWGLAVSVLLVLFFIFDLINYGKESKEDLARDVAERQPIEVHGKINLLFLAGVPLGVLLKSPEVGGKLTQFLQQLLACPDLTQGFWGEAVMLAMAGLSLLSTPRDLRNENGFSWEAITEVAVLFAGIFITMVPALQLLAQHGHEFGDLRPWQYFWMSGALSSFLDNAPTYLVFASMAAGGQEAIGQLAYSDPLFLKAISCGSVFMGANTYIGNGPNFMVKAIADEAGYRTPSFFGYMIWSGLILLPLFVLITFVFFLE